MNDEICHYGVKGMRWGHRKSLYNNPAVTSKKRAYKAAKKEYAKSSDKAYSYSRMHPIGRYVSKKKKLESNKLGMDVINKYVAMRNAKKDYKTAKRNVVKQNVKNYNKSLDKSSSLSDRADKTTREAKRMYKALGKNPLSRIITAAKNKTPEAKAYNKKMDEAIRQSNIADKSWEKTIELYKKTGYIYTTRLLNIVKYG